jgi:hypothetical protein
VRVRTIERRGWCLCDMLWGSHWLRHRHWSRFCDNRSRLCDNRSSNWCRWCLENRCKNWSLLRQCDEGENHGEDVCV